MKKKLFVIIVISFAFIIPCVQFLRAETRLSSIGDKTPERILGEESADEYLWAKFPRREFIFRYRNDVTRWQYMETTGPVYKENSKEIKKLHKFRCDEFVEGWNSIIGFERLMAKLNYKENKSKIYYAICDPESGQAWELRERGYESQYKGVFKDGPDEPRQYAKAMASLYLKEGREDHKKQIFVKVNEVIRVGYMNAGKWESEEGQRKINLARSKEFVDSWNEEIPESPLGYLIYGDAQYPDFYEERM